MQQRRAEALFAFAMINFRVNLWMDKNLLLAIVQAMRAHYDQTIWRRKRLIQMRMPL
jgi:hypothetical protein